MVKDGCALLALVVMLGACVDVEGGRTATYGSPCATFGGVLLCGRESGGADPAQPGSGAERPTCESACEVVVMCFPGQTDVPSCTGECESSGIPQSVLDCVVASGCDYPNACGGG